MREDSIVYEYISINVKRDLEQMYIDCYKNFGWLHISNEKKDYYINSNPNPNPNTIEIKFKRDRNTKNKDELQKLQKKCERAFLTIDKLEKMPEALAISYALMIGIIATIFMAISVFYIIENIWFLAILCGIIGIIGCALPYSIYKNVKNKKEIENKTKIDEQQNIIHDIYAQVRKILLESE